MHENYYDEIAASYPTAWEKFSTWMLVTTQVDGNTIDGEILICTKSKCGDCSGVFNGCYSIHQIPTDMMLGYFIHFFESEGCDVELNGFKQTIDTYMKIVEGV